MMLAAATLAAAGSLRPLQPEQEQRGGPNDAGGSSTSKLPEAEAAQNFVIFSRARSGTTWLISMLNGHPEVSCDGELLLRVKTDTALSDFYEAFDRTGRLHEGTKARERSKRRIGAQGFKWFHYQAGIELFEPYYSWNSDNATRARHDARAQEWAAWLRRHRFKVVVFEREDRLARMVSEAKHNMLMDYVCTTEKCVDEHRRRKVYLKPEHLKLKLRDDEELGTGTMGWLGRHGFDASQVPPLPCRPARNPLPHAHARGGRLKRGLLTSTARPPPHLRLDPARARPPADDPRDVPRAGRGARGAGAAPVRVPGRRPEAAHPGQRDHEDGHRRQAGGRDRKPAGGRGSAAGNKVPQGALRPAVFRVQR